MDNVTIANLKQTLVCEPTRNTGLPACPGGCSTPTGLSAASAQDVNLCTDSGVQVSWAQDAGNWGDGGSGTRTYDVLRNGSPIQTGIAYGTTSSVDTTGVNGTSYTYTVRYNNGCGSSAISGGAAASDQAPVCTASDPCHVAGTCDPWTGLCSNPPAPDGTPCSDGNVCTQTDTCQAGACDGANPVICVASDACHLAGTCDPGSGLCSNPQAPDGTPCSDGNACTASDVCTSGACGGTAVPPPSEVDDGVRLAKSGGGTDVTWNPALNSTVSDLVRGVIAALPVGPGGGDELCLADNTAATLYTDVVDPVIGAGFWYLVRGDGACGTGPYGFEGVNGVPGAPRVTTTCP